MESAAVAHAAVTLCRRCPCGGDNVPRFDTRSVLNTTSSVEDSGVQECVQVGHLFAQVRQVVAGVDDGPAGEGHGEGDQSVGEFLWIVDAEFPEVGKEYGAELVVDLDPSVGDDAIEFFVVVVESRDVGLEGEVGEVCWVFTMVLWANAFGSIGPWVVRLLVTAVLATGLSWRTSSSSPTSCCMNHRSPQVPAIAQRTDSTHS